MNLFVDTNLFLQCRDLESLSWSDVVSAPECVVFVPRTVQQEIDRLKNDGNPRRAKRARRASQILKQILDSPIGELEVAANPGPIRLRLAPRQKTRDVEDVGLDLSRSDDRIIAEVLIWSQSNPQLRTALLTKDTGVMASAMDCQLAYIEIPDDWLLKPEPDERDREIRQLKDEVALLKRSCPDIQASLRYSGSEVVEQRLETCFIEYSELAEDEIAELGEEIRKRHPLREIQVPGRVPGQLRGLWRPPSRTAIAQYAERYGEWIEECLSRLKNLPSLAMSRVGRWFPIEIVIGNQGSKPAESLLVELSVEGTGLRVAHHPDYMQWPWWKLPEPPKPPQGRFEFPVSPYQGLPDIFGSTRRGEQQPRDPSEVYWTSHDRDRLRVRCEYFRHQAEPVRISFAVFVAEDLSQPVSGLLRAMVSAANLPVPIDVRQPFTVRADEGSPVELARALIDEAFRDG